LGYLVYILVNLVETLLRVFPFPSRTGLVCIGKPDRKSPVLLTCNFHLTVQRLKRALKGMDVYLLVANSRGINVWCAATGGLLTHHDVISVIKTSGIEELVDHRNVILPQLAATGVEARTVHQKTGWRVVFGPVHIKDVKDFLSSGEKDENMRQVRFDTVQRLEMATIWAFPLTVVSALIILPLWSQIFPPWLLLVWGFSLAIFLPFPLYSRWLKPKNRQKSLIVLDIRQGGFVWIIWGVFLLSLVIYGFLSGSLDWGSFLGWAGGSLFVLFLISIELMGTTPTYKSSMHEDRLFSVSLEQSKCRGAGFCQDVCPRDCYQVNKEKHSATMPQAGSCVQCGACIVQCPFDALSFRSPDGRIIPPNTIRKYKLNLMGKRISEP